MAYTGARIEKLTQLTAGQVDDHEGITCLLIYSSRSGLKTAQSRRFVPIHDELLKLGFADHVVELQKNEGLPPPCPER